MQTDAKILVVDDEPDIMSVLVYHLTRAGYRVATAANGPSALRAALTESVKPRVKRSWGSPTIKVTITAKIACNIIAARGTVPSERNQRGNKPSSAIFA